MEILTKIIGGKMKVKIGLFFIVLVVLNTALFSQEPEWQWASQAGGNGFDGGGGICSDLYGNSYVTGIFEGTANFGSYSLTSSGLEDIFIAKMDANGNWLWATQAGGSESEGPCGITIDNDYNCYVTGEFISTVNFGSYSLTSSGEEDIFVAKMDANGNWLWATKAGGSSQDSGEAIVIDNDYNCYVTGKFKVTASFGSYSLTSSGARDIFVAKMDTNGNWLWATQAEGSDWEGGYGIANDNTDNYYVTGYFRDTVNFGTVTLTSSGERDIFVAKMDANGNWVWATKAGGSDGEDETGFKITTDNQSNSYVTGIFEGTAYFGSYSLTSSGEGDIFVAKMDVNGNWLWATKAGGNYQDNGLGIAIDNDYNCYVTGQFLATVSFGSYSLTSSGLEDIFIAKIDTNGNWVWVTKAGGSSGDSGYGITTDNGGNSYVTGIFQDTASFGSYSLTSSGNWDIYVVKLGNDTSVENEIIPTKTELSNYPNPFNPNTTIEFSIQNNSPVELSIFNTKGQIVKTLAQNEFMKGSHSIIWNGDDDFGNSLSSGVYLYKLRVNDKTEAVKKCLLLK